MAKTNDYRWVFGKEPAGRRRSQDYEGGALWRKRASVAGCLGSESEAARGSRVRLKPEYLQQNECSRPDPGFEDLLRAKLELPQILPYLPFHFCHAHAAGNAGQSQQYRNGRDDETQRDCTRNRRLRPGNPDSRCLPEKPIAANQRGGNQGEPSTPARSPDMIRS